MTGPIAQTPEPPYVAVIFTSLRTEGANDQTKARYAFVYGDLRRVHRTGLIACVYRASEWRHKDVELAAHDLLQLLDKTSG